MSVSISVQVTDSLGATATAVATADIGTSAPIIPVDRTTLWQPGVTYNGGIPNYTNIFKTLSPSGGNDLTQIQNALDAAGAIATATNPQVVKLSPGVFKISGDPIRIRHSYVVLRGSGPGNALAFQQGLPAGPDPVNIFGTYPAGFIADSTATQIQKTDNISDPGQNSCICLGFDNSQFATTTALAADALVGSFQLTLKSNPGIFVGEILYIDQNTANHPDVFWGPNNPPGGAGRAWFQRIANHSLTQIVEVTAVSGNTITFNTPLHCSFLVTYGAAVTRWNWSDPNMGLVAWSGIEDLYCYGGRTGNIEMRLSKYCWTKHVESHWGYGAGVGINSCFRCELRDSFIHTQAYFDQGGAGYLLALSYATSDCLVENCISWFGNKQIVMQTAGGGNVLAYNYMDDAGSINYLQLGEAGINACHMTTSHFELMEGNYSHCYSGDSYWGNAIDITAFRNQFSGHRSGHKPLSSYIQSGQPYIDDGNRAAAKIQTHSLRHNLVGNVLGYQGMVLYTLNSGPAPFDQTTGGWKFEDLTAVNDGNTVFMWYIGEIQSATVTWDPNTYQTLLRDGNWDWVTKTQTWLGIGGTQNNPLGTPKPIPDSLYLSGKPAFFGSNPWPWVDPSTGTTFVLPAKVRFDAGTPNML